MILSEKESEFKTLQIAKNDQKMGKYRVFMRTNVIELSILAVS